jgi:hypothetical protein
LQVLGLAHRCDFLCDLLLSCLLLLLLLQVDHSLPFPLQLQAAVPSVHLFRTFVFVPTERSFSELFIFLDFPLFLLGLKFEFQLTLAFAWLVRVSLMVC